MSTSEPAEKPPTTGLVGGKYEIGRLLGRGGMGSVWEARHVSLGTKVAIKFVEVEQAQSEEARARFQNEARAAATIQSKHAIKVYDHGLLEDGRPYIVMELLIGEPLDKRLDLLQRMSLPDTARLVQQVCRALQQAHDAGITHRDLKPENIFLERNADDEVDIAKVLDFGIAKIRDPASSPVSSSTKTGVLMGTPFFMSPEQARGMKTVDHRSDLWSLAVIVFRCVTGQLPFDGESLGDLLVKICAAPVPLPSSVLPGLPPQFDAWMQKALDRDPGVRFQTAQEFSDSLAMVAGVSVRLASRRSNDFASTPAPRVTPTALGGGSPSQPWMPPPVGSLTGGIAPQTQDLHQQPIPIGTSSPLTASANPVAAQKGIGAGALSVMALVLLVGAAGGSFYWFTHRTTGSVATATDVAAHPASGSASSASTAPVAASPPADTTPPPEPPSLPVASKGTVLRATPGGMGTPPEPPKPAKHGKGHGGATPNTVRTPAPPPLAPPPTPHFANHPATPTTSGSDPGY
jgi:serine/threonine protein kinase